MIVVISFIRSLKLTMYDFKKIKDSPVVERFRFSFLFRVIVHVEDMDHVHVMHVHMTSYRGSLVYASVTHFQPFIEFHGTFRSAVTVRG